MLLLVLLAQLDAGAPSVVLRFPCDDKYATAETCDEAAWLERVLAAPDDGPNLLAHESGGPGGAVWNSSATPLFLFVRGARGVVRIGKKKPLTLTRTTKGEWAWTRVEYKTWSSALSGSQREPYRSFTVTIDGAARGSFRFAEGE